MCAPPLKSMEEQFEELRVYLRGLAGSKVLVVTHRNADPDAIGCAFIMRDACASLGIKVEICIPEGPDKQARAILESFGFSWREECEPEDHLLVCDTSNKMMLGKAQYLLDAVKSLIVIDHHSPPGSLVERATASLIIPEPASTVLAVLLADKVGVRLDSTIATIGLTGILYDTRRFLTATPNVFLASKILLESGGDYALALKFLEPREDRSQAIARLKGVQRASVLDVCGYLVAVSESSAHEAAVAKALVTLGVDLALVAGGHDISRASVRVSGRLQEKGFDSSKLVEKVARMIGGEAGGHPGASGISKYEVKRNLKIVKNEVLRQLLLNAVEMIMEICDISGNSYQ
ncbi:MAG: DHH family phosphoesterase [Infirmifilum sp.]